MYTTHASTYERDACKVSPANPAFARALFPVGRIVGFREHVFTHDVSAVANFFSLQELNFVSATQRALDNPLHVSQKPDSSSLTTASHAWLLLLLLLL